MKTVFRLGVFDGASTEFAQGLPSNAVQVNADSAHAAADWYGVQPAAMMGASLRGRASMAAAPRAILFTIPSAPAAAYRLHVSLLIESRSVPPLRVCINGRCGMFYLESPLDAHMGDSDDTFQSVHAPADVAFDFPGSYLRSGVNTITFQVIQEPGRAVADASLTYDAIELDQAPASELPEASSAAITPTVFYQGQPGNLKELVDVYIRGKEKFGSGDSVELTVGKNEWKRKFHDGEDFGEERIEFAVPEFPAKTTAHLGWTISGQKFSREQSIDPQKKWTLYLVPHIHLDVGYSDYQPKVAAIQTQAMDEGMDFAKSHPGFCYSVDGSWDLAQYMKTRSVADQQRAISAMKDGQLFVPAEYANLLTGFPTAETLIRSLYASAQFSRLHGTPFNYADISDVPTYSWSYASILAAAGIHYFVAGPNGHLTRGPVLIQGRLNENSPFWWVGPDGGKVLFWYGRHYWEGGIFFGTPPEVNAGRETIPVFLKTYEHPGYRADAVILFGTQQENTDLFPQQAELAAQWNRQFAYPAIRYSGFYAALKHIADQFGGNIPTVSGDGGPYWEDGIAASARYAAMERGNESRAPSAEKLSTLTSMISPRLAADKLDLDRMWTDIVLMDEHTWDSHDAYSDPSSEETARQSKVKEMYAINARQITDYVARNSMAELANAIPAGRGSLIVFNTLNWKRSALASFDLQKGREIVDPATGAVVPVEVVRESENLLRVRFLATDVPAFGYKVYKLVPSKAPVPAAVTKQTNTIENRYYRVELDPASGAVRGIYDKQLKRELVNQQSPYRFGQYLYVSGGDQRPNTLLQYRTLELEPTLQVNGARGGHLISVTRTPYGWLARMESTDTNTPAVNTEIRLFDDAKKIEFIEDIDKKAVRTREAVYFAFPFAMDQPRFQYEIQNGVVDPAKNMYPGAGHEWFSVQHWVSVEQNQRSATVMPLDAPLVTLGDIYRGAWPAQFGHRPGTIFSYAMNNYWSTNYNAEQSGHLRLRYLITSAASTDAAALSRMGWDEATPLELDLVTRQDKALPPPPPAHAGVIEASYLNLNDPDLLVEDWKPAEDGNGTILRLLDLGGAKRKVNVQTPLLDLQEAIETDAVERDQKELQRIGPHAFEVTIHPHQIVTVRLVGKIAPHQSGR
ncbi:MAG: glycoside hydrolase family 38 C-terminal domain-containing protein [Acidobacteriota bacterium]